MLQLKQSRLQAEMNEMMLFYEEDKQVTDDEILGLENCCMQKLLTERNP